LQSCGQNQALSCSVGNLCYLLYIVAS
jgi:hypothetical protein